MILKVHNLENKTIDQNVYFKYFQLENSEFNELIFYNN